MLLRSLIHRADELRPSELLDIRKGSEPYLASATPSSAEELLSLDEVERLHITRVLNSLANNQTQAAKTLGISLSTLKRKTRQYRPV